MKVRTEFPRKIAAPRDIFIPMADGVRLAATIWMPEGADQDPVPAILNYKPYRKRDFTAVSDAPVQSYIAGHGYAGVRVDIRGSGDSEGILRGEYLEPELNDAVEVVAWLAAQPWCSGKVGMFGLSWSGFNALMVAARRPPALKAVISACSTDDRYADDIHMMGGCLLTDKFTWGARMLASYMSPPDPAVVGDRWRNMWFERLENNGLWAAEWHEHQRRDMFYQHASICENYSAIEVPVYLVGGWLDGYTNAVFRMAEHLQCPRKILIGPWPHKSPHLAKPGPQIGYLQECLRWWDHWLKGRDTGIMDEPMIRVWMRDCERPRTSLAVWSGRWIAEQSWPVSDAGSKQLFLQPGRLADESIQQGTEIAIRSPQSTGHTIGRWFPQGFEPDLPDDQRHEMGHATTFDSEPLAKPLEILGAPHLHLEVAADKGKAFLAAVLSEVFPDGSATLVTYGLLNLTRRNSHETPEELEPGRRYSISMRLNDVAHRFGAGNAIRLALSTSLWPTVWPSPEAVTLRLQAERAHLELPLRASTQSDGELPPFPQPEVGPPCEAQALVPPRSDWRVTRDLRTSQLVHRQLTDSGITRLAHGLEFGALVDVEYRVRSDDPLSAQIRVKHVRTFSRGEWQVRVDSVVLMTPHPDAFHLHASLDCFEGDRRIYAKTWDKRVARDLL